MNTNCPECTNDGGACVMCGGAKPYEGTEVKRFGGKPLSEYKNEIIKDDRYIKKMRHYQTKPQDRTSGTPLKDTPDGSAGGCLTIR